MVLVEDEVSMTCVLMRCVQLLWGRFLGQIYWLHLLIYHYRLRCRIRYKFPEWRLAHYGQNPHHVVSSVLKIFRDIVSALAVTA